jgi:hypothetical protein
MCRVDMHRQKHMKPSKIIRAAVAYVHSHDQTQTCTHSYTDIEDLHSSLPEITFAQAPLTNTHTHTYAETYSQANKHARTQDMK